MSTPTKAAAELLKAWDNFEATGPVSLDSLVAQVANAELSAAWESGDDARIEAAVTALRARLIGDKFAELLRSEIGEEKFAEVRRLNRTEPFGSVVDGVLVDGECCASHEFVDANEVMAEAFKACGSEIPEDFASNDDFCALWGKAWSHAKRTHLTAGE